MKKTELTAMTVAALKTLAKKKKVSLPAGGKKADIIDALTARAKAKKSAAKKVITKKAAAAMKAKAAAKKTVKAVKTAVERKASQTRAGARQAPKTITPVREWRLPPGVEEPLLAKERVEDAKYYTGPALKQTVASAGELPQGYGEDNITLMMRDPYMAYAYWEMTPERIEREKKWFGWDSKLCVRLYDVTGIHFDGRNALGFFDQEVYERIGNWYFDLGRPSHSFCADLGLLAPSGRFLTLSRSNYITMPRDGVSDVVNDEWMLLDEEFLRLYGIPSGLSSPQIQEMVKRRRELEISSPGMSFRRQAKRK